MNVAGYDPLPAAVDQAGAIGVAAVAWDEGGSFRAAIGADPAVRARLSDEQLESLFDPRRFLRNLGGVFEQLEKVPVEGT